MKILFVLFTLACLSATTFAQTYFYKRIKIVKNGQTYNTNDDGHYVTIGDNCIYDSDADGYCLDNSNMKYIKTKNGIKTFYGKSYYGLCFCFTSSDFQRLNLKDDQNIYVYVRCAPSSKVTHRPSSDESGNAPIMIIAPGNITTPSSNSSTKNNRRSCPSCNGSGKSLDQITYSPNYTGKQLDEYCSTCGKWGSPHSHRRPMCRTCYGKGYLDF